MNKIHSATQARKTKLLGLALIITCLGLFTLAAIMFYKHFNSTRPISMSITTQTTSLPNTVNTMSNDLSSSLPIVSTVDPNETEYMSSTNSPDIINTMNNIVSSSPPIISTRDPDNIVKYKNYSLKEPIKYITTGRALGNVLYFNPALLCINAGYVSRVDFRLYTKWKETVPLYLFLITGSILEYKITHRYAVFPEKDTTEWQTISIPSPALPIEYGQFLALGMQDSSNTIQIYAVVPISSIGVIVGNINENTTKFKALFDYHGVPAMSFSVVEYEKPTTTRPVFPHW
ncbi:unnamed protein product [Rotaria magnacalcarata]|uniref:Uncharacterized protein n=2 Tax=Rotaria magnacalcarata TaxID=392030 RepID=A0A816RM63_9BILA|nr:unnamed protein product [Rotaria magnacalcarata]CAF3777589.1 unnamed protein product [Rotaria magnacalcarata]CAF3978494.1 unnamed protein product [Rotaria magnacalcarata]CAF4228498.1 unnamed protein product [Rotaria magnacalcarata]